MPFLSELSQPPRRAGLLAIALGVISASGFAPLGLWPLAMLAMGVFAMLVPLAKGWRQALWLGWLFGIGHFTFGNNWIATAFTYQSNMPAVLGWAAVPLISLYLAIYPALAAGAARAIAGKRRGLGSALIFAACWIAAEWLRSWVFTGYGWNPFAMVMLGPFDRPGLAAIAPIMGTYAVSGVAVLLSASTVYLLCKREFLTSGIIAALLVAGMYWPAVEAQEGTLQVTIAQPDIRQDRLSNPLFYDANFDRLAQLSGPLEDDLRLQGQNRLVLWPESGMSDYLQDGLPQRFYNATTVLGSPEYARARLARTIGSNAALLTGALELVVEDGEAVGVHNTVAAINDQGAITGRYAKAHLVPFGEYLPLQEWLEPMGISRLVPGSIYFRPGPGPRSLDLGDYGRAGIQICYEIVFSGQVTDRNARPDYIFNPSNDGWFGAFGPPQHFAQARMRAIEEGLPVLRATTSGISGIIDPRGVVRRYAGRYEMTRIDAIIPPAAAPTLFARMGNILPLVWAVVFLGAGLIAMRRQGG